MWRQQGGLILVMILVTILILILGYSLISEDEYRSTGQNLWFYLGLFLAGGFLSLYALSFNRFVVRLTALLFSLLLIACIMLNLVWYSKTVYGSWWGLERRSSNSLADLIYASGRLDDFLVYTIIHDYYKEKTLIVSPGALDEAGLESDRLQNWGRLANIETQSYQPNLTEQEAQELLQLNHIEIELENGEPYFFIIESLETIDTVKLVNYKDQKFIVPNTLLSVGKGQ